MVTGTVNIDGIQVFFEKSGAYNAEKTKALNGEAEIEPIITNPYIF